MTTNDSKLKNQLDNAYSDYIKDLIRYIERLEYENEELKEQIRLINNIF